MAKEIERKFLVTGEFRHLAVMTMDIVQGYLSVDPQRIIRIRITDEGSVLSVKAPSENSEFTRNEWEFEIPHGQAEEMLKVCLPGIISKTRYIVPYKNHRFEVDVFHGRNDGLVIAELELLDENEEFEKPGWLGREVTGLPEYDNCNLI